ncbi:MAG: hypothetical protein A2255_03200 [Candidatus Melainabacteria bacterium RIFOXYA2_FULL_32_9]|nr:MAG: hypothetical protein A2255_03200 [Candidatus Melainabacteria bacterium RIFOXYA2_FULL_32_9]
MIYNHYIFGDRVLVIKVILIIQKMFYNFCNVEAKAENNVKAKNRLNNNSCKFDNPVFFIRGKNRD